MASWPAGLPSPTAASEPTTQEQEDSVRSPNEVGPPKVRRRFTGVWKFFDFELELTPAQQAIFWPWYETTLKRGALPFDWVDLRTGAAQVYGFRKKPTERWVAGNTGAILQRVSISLETR